MKTRVLVVGMLDSIHLARWLTNFRDDDVEFTLFPSTPNRRLHDEITYLLEGLQNADFRVANNWQLISWVLAPIQLIFGLELRHWLLGRELASNTYEVVHAAELQHAGYLLLDVDKLVPLKRSTKVYISNWGSDIFWFQRKKRHQKKLIRLLKLADYYSCECSRDVALAKNLGFKGRVLEVVPNSGGIKLPDIDDVKFRKERNTIAVKGYHGWAGRALSILSAMELDVDFFKEFKVVIFSADVSTSRKAKSISSKFDIEWHPKGSLTHSEVMEIMLRSRIYVGVSRTDGISTSMLEAMAHGAIPVQTNTACCEEWFTNGITGIALESFEPRTILEGMKAALEIANDEMPRTRNYLEIRERAEYWSIQRRLAGLYNRL